MPGMYTGPFATSTEMLAYRFELRCCWFSDAIVTARSLRAGSPTFLLVHPLRLLLCARITDYGELHILVSMRREWANTGNLLAKLLRAQIPVSPKELV
jgi:hypothetical protein